MRAFIKKILPLAIIYLVILIIFFRGLKNFFLQDDFLNIYLGWTKTPSYLFHTYLAFRPIPYEIFGNFVFAVLAMNPILTHLILLLAHFLNVYLLWRLVGIFTKKKGIKFFVAFLYGVNSIHFGVLFWQTANYLLFGTTFLLIFLNLLSLNYKKSTKGKFLLLIFFYILLILTNEVFTIFPIFLFFLSFFDKRLKNLLFPTILLAFLSSVFRFYFKAYSAGPDYALGTTLEVVKTTWWYILRGLNLAEGIKLMEREQIYLSLILFFVFSSCLVISVLIFLKTRKKPDKKILLFGIIWFLFFGVPYFILVHHVSAYYLNTALIGFVILITYVWFPVFTKKEKRYKLLIVIFLTIYGIISYLNVRFLQKNSWIIWRGEIARKYLTLTKKLYPTLPKGATIVFQKTSVSHEEISIALYKDIAFKLIYKDPTLKVIYDEAHVLMPYEYGISDGGSSVKKI